MASVAHCFFCFEILSASFDHREPISLALVEQLYQQWQLSKSGRLPGKSVALNSDDRLDADESMNDEGSAPPTTNHNDNGNGDDGDDDVDVDDDDDDTTNESDDLDDMKPASGNQAPGRLQLPSISRLQGLSPSPSSASSTPPLSTNSSRSVLTNPSSISSTFSSPNRQSSKSSAPSPIPTTPSLSESETYPLFVTWNTISRSGHKSLRGCIGTFEAQDLPTGLKTYALTSAFDDTRFAPITASELPHLQCALTLLTNFTPCEHALDWTLGIHGLRISFIQNNKRYGATYLPDVATEQGWTKPETLESLMRKAGWDGAGSGGSSGRNIFFGRRSANTAHNNNNNNNNNSSSSTGSGQARDGSTEDKKEPWKRVMDFRAVRYQGLKASSRFGEWREWRRWVENESGISATATATATTTTTLPPSSLGNFG